MELYYYLIVLLSAFFVFFKSGFNRLSVLIVLIFWEGLFKYWGILDYYKIFITAYALALCFRNLSKQLSDNEKNINLYFLFFSASFWLSYYFTGGELITILSQYGYKYGMIFLLYHGLKDIVFNGIKQKYLKILLFNILFVQVLLSVFKIILIGFPIEYHVGSMVHGSGGIAVVMPILGLIFYWTIKNGRFQKKDWLISCSFLLIALASGKRAPVFLFPLFYFALFTYDVGKYRISRILKLVPFIIPFVLILFYIGLRLTPSLNPEGKVWGNFSPGYAFNYAFEYNLGTTGKTTSGRGGSFFLLFNPEKMNLRSAIEIIFGKGLYDTAILIYDRFLGGAAYGIQHTGLMGEPVRIVYSLGYAGFISMLLFSLSVINITKDTKIKLLIGGFYLWEFFLYGNQVLFNNASAVILLFILFYREKVPTIKKSNALLMKP